MDLDDFISETEPTLYQTIETYILNNQMQCMIFFAWFATLINAMLFNSNQTNKINDLQCEINDLQIEYDQMTDRNNNLENETKKLESKIKSLIAQLEHLQLENHSLNNRIIKERE